MEAAEVEAEAAQVRLKPQFFFPAVPAAQVHVHFRSETLIQETIRRKLIPPTSKVSLLHSQKSCSSMKVRMMESTTTATAKMCMSGRPPSIRPPLPFTKANPCVGSGKETVSTLSPADLPARPMQGYSLMSLKIPMGTLWKSCSMKLVRFPTSAIRMPTLPMP